MAVYRRVYDSHHLQADCQEPGSALRDYPTLGNRVWATFLRVRNTNRKSCLASQTQPSACCADERKCPKSLLEPTDFGTGHGDAATTGIRALFCLNFATANDCLLCFAQKCLPPYKSCLRSHTVSNKLSLNYNKRIDIVHSFDCMLYF